MEKSSQPYYQFWVRGFKIDDFTTRIKAYRKKLYQIDQDKFFQNEMTNLSLLQKYWCSLQYH